MANARKLPSGHYRCLAYVGTDENGKRLYKSFTAPTKREAERMASDYEAEKEAHVSVTFDSAANNYIKAKSNVLSPSTIRVYKNMKKNHFQQIAGMDVNTIKQDTVQKLVNRWSAELSPKSVRNAFGFFTAVMQFEIPGFHMNITLPQKRRTDFYIPSEKDIQIIYSHLKGTRMELPFLLASQLGLRVSEICGITKDCIGENTVTIKQALVKGEDGYVFKEPKTYSGNRDIPCSTKIIKMLKEQGGVNFRSISKSWERVMKNIDVPYFHFHALRHYFASQALLQGIPQMYIAEMMGHSSTNMIEKVYQHTFPDAKKEFQSRMVALSDKLMV